MYCFGYTLGDFLTKASDHSSDVQNEINSTYVAPRS
jgi:hypothetical protein